MTQHVSKVASVCFCMAHSPFAPDPPTRRRGSHDPPSLLQLQLAAGGPTANDVGATAENLAKYMPQ